MKQVSTLFLKGVIFLIVIAVMALCIFWLPLVIGSINMGGYDPILLGLYVTVIPFFMALYQAFMLLGYIDKSEAFSNSSVKALTNIKYCAITICALYTAGMPYIYWVADKDDAPGVVAIGVIIIFASFVISTAAAVFARLFQNAVDIKRENDLTV